MDRGNMRERVGWVSRENSLRLMAGCLTTGNVFSFFIQSVRALRPYYQQIQQQILLFNSRDFIEEMRSDLQNTDFTFFLEQSTGFASKQIHNNKWQPLFKYKYENFYCYWTHTRNITYGKTDKRASFHFPSHSSYQ